MTTPHIFILDWYDAQGYWVAGQYFVSNHTVADSEFRQEIVDKCTSISDTWLGRLHVVVKAAATSDLTGGNALFFSHEFAGMRRTTEGANVMSISYVSEIE